MVHDSFPPPSPPPGVHATPGPADANPPPLPLLLIELSSSLVPAICPPHPSVCEAATMVNATTARSICQPDRLNSLAPTLILVILPVAPVWDWPPHAKLIPKSTAGALRRANPGGPALPAPVHALLRTAASLPRSGATSRGSRAFVF